MGKEIDKVKELRRKIIQYRIAMEIKPLLSVEWIKNNILNQKEDE